MLLFFLSKSVGAKTFPHPETAFAEEEYSTAMYQSDTYATQKSSILTNHPEEYKSRQHNLKERSLLNSDELQLFPDLGPFPDLARSAENEGENEDKVDGSCAQLALLKAGH